MHLIQSLKNEYCFDLPMFSKYPAISINSYFNKMTLVSSSSACESQVTIKTVVQSETIGKTKILSIL